MTELKEKPVAVGQTPAPLRVLVVCTGNTCRSPMAAALLNDAARPREVCSACAEEREPLSVLAISAGLAANEGEPISPNAVAALEAVGIPSLPSNDYRAHRARNVTHALMREADIVLPISGGHAMQLMLRYPEFSSKLRTLPMDIADPYGGDLAAYRACLVQLRMALSLVKLREGERP